MKTNVQYETEGFVGNSRKELGHNIVKGIGLGLPDDENVGKRVKFKNPTCEIEKKIHIIIGCQRAWGYDKNGNYTMIPAYRGVVDGEEDTFGRPLHLYEVEFVD